MALHEKGAGMRGKKMRLIEVGLGNQKRCAALPQMEGIEDALKVALFEFSDGEIFFPFGEGLSETNVMETGFSNSDIFALSLQGLIKRVTYHKGDTWGTLNFIGEAMKRAFPRVVLAEHLSHEEVLRLLRVALTMTPPTGKKKGKYAWPVATPSNLGGF